MKKQILIGAFALLVAVGGLVTPVDVPSTTNAFTVPSGSIGPVADNATSPRSWDPNLNNSG